MQIQDKPTNNMQPPDWLKHLREHSWEMELLITGFVLFGLLQLPDYLDSLHASWQIKTGRSFFIVLPYWIMTFSVRIMTFNLIALLLLRGYWIGLIGLSSAFPAGVDSSRLPFSDKFKTYFSKKSINLERTTVSLDKLCSTIFAFSFLIIFMTISFLLFFFVFVFAALLLSYLMNVFPDARELIASIFVILMLIFFLCGLLFAFDFLALGLLKRVKVKWFSVPYYYISIIISRVSLSFLYEPIYYTLVSNIRRRTLGTILLLYVAGAYGLQLVGYNNTIYFPDELTEHRISSHYYENLKSSDRRIMDPIIQSDVIKENYLKLFIPYDVADNDSLKASCPDLYAFFDGGFSTELRIRSASDVDSVELSEDFYQNRVKANLECFSQFYTITIDDSVYTDLHYYFFTHPNKEEPGILTYIGVNNLSFGPHLLKIDRRRHVNNSGAISSGNEINYIPFRKE